MSDSQIRRLASRITALEKAKLQSKQPTLAFSTIDGGGAIQATDESETLTMIMGKQYDGTNTSAVVTGPTPPTPAAPLVTEAPGLLRVYWDGTFGAGSVAPMDFSRVMVYAEPLSTYDGPDPLNQTLMVGEFNSATGAEVTVSLNPGVEYVVYLVCWTQAGKFGVASGPATGTPGNVLIDADLDGLVETYRQATAPVGAREGSTWYDSDDGNKAYRLEGGSWIPMPVGTGAIATDAVTDIQIAPGAVRDEHIPISEINPSRITANLVGGGLSNLIFDPAFSDSAFRSQRMAGVTGAPAAVSFLTYQNLAPSNVSQPYSGGSVPSEWAGGPHTSLSMGVDNAGSAAISISVTGSGLAPGEVYLSALVVPTQAFKASRSYSFKMSNIKIWLDSFMNGRARVEWLDSADAVISTFTTSVMEWTDIWTTEIDVVSPATAPAKARVSWIYENMGGSSPTFPAQSDWAYLTRIRPPGKSYRVMEIVENGMEIDPESWVIEVDLDLVTAGVITRVPLTSSPIPASQGVIYTASCQWQADNSSAFEPYLEARFFNASGGVISTGWLRGLGYYAGSQVYPGWADGRKAWEAPFGAVSCQVFARFDKTSSPSQTGKVRLRNPGFSSSGIVDRGSRYWSDINPYEIRYALELLEGSKELFWLNMNHEQEIATLEMTGTVDVDGDITATGRVIQQGGPMISQNEYTANSGSLASGGQANITVAHGLGVTPSVVVGHLEDGTWSTQFGWRVASRDSTNVQINFLNQGPNTGTAVLRFRLIY